MIILFSAVAFFLLGVKYSDSVMGIWTNLIFLSTKVYLSILFKFFKLFDRNFKSIFLVELIKGFTSHHISIEGFETRVPSRDTELG